MTAGNIGSTPPYIAAEQSHADVGELLVSTGAGKDKVKKRGR